MDSINIAMVCKIMPLYRYGVFKVLSNSQSKFIFTIFGDTKKQAGIETIDWKYSNKVTSGGLRWIRTKNFFYKPESLLWQSKIVRNIILSKFKVFIFEGAISHPAIWVFAILCKLFRKKVLFWTHGFKGVDNGLKKNIRKFFFKYLADGLLLYGNTQKELMVNAGFNPDQLFVIYNSLSPDEQFGIQENIDEDNLLKEKACLFKEPSAFTLIFIGRLVPGKEVLKILESIKRLNELSIKTNCIIIGDGPEKSKLDDYVLTNCLSDQVVFLGELYEEENIGRYFLMSDMMISPGNVGLNCIHSLAYGVPVMTHDNFCFQNPEVEAIVNEKTGIFFTYRDFENLIYKLKNWITNKCDSKEIKNNCKNMIIEIYNPNNQANCIIEAVNAICPNNKNEKN